MTEHEANNSVIGISGKLRASLTDEQKVWVQAAAAEVAASSRRRPSRSSTSRSQSCKNSASEAVADVDKTSFIKIAEPLQDKLAKGLGPHAAKSWRSAARSNSDGWAADLVLVADRHLKRPVLDPLERVLMQLCGVCLVGFTSTTLLDVVARMGGRPLLWPQEVTSAFFIYGVFIGAAVATRRNDHLQLLALTEFMSGATRRVFEVMICAVVMCAALFLVVYGWQNFLTGFEASACRRCCR